MPAQAAAATAILDWKRISTYAANLVNKASYPTVIIGSGLGGLCCGAYLSKEGIPVTVVEQRDVPGGYACSFDRDNKRFTFDVSLHGMAAYNNATARILADLGVLKGLELVELSEIYHLKALNFSLSIPEHNPDAYVQRLAAHFPDEEEGIKRFVKEIVSVAEEGDRLHQKGMPPKIIFPIKYPKLYKWLNKSLSELMQVYIKNPALQNILSSLWDFHGLPPSRVSGLYYAAAKGDFLKNGSYYIKQRCRDLSNHLAELIRGNGGQVLTNTTVKEIVVKKGSVYGVKTADGEFIGARAVVSNANVLDTFGTMIDTNVVPSSYLKDLKSFRPSLSTFIVWLGLNREIRGELGATGIQVLSEQGPNADYESCIRGNIEKVSFRISVYDNIYEGYSRPGTSTLRIFCLSGYAPWKKFEADYRAWRKKDYYEQKEKWTRVLIERAEAVIPELSEMIEITEAATPLTNWRFTKNRQGAIYGFEQSVENAYLKRVDHRTPIKGLYLASAWCNPGGGFAGALLAGQLAFNKMMEDWGRKK